MARMANYEEYGASQAIGDETRGTLIEQGNEAEVLGKKTQNAGGGRRCFPTVASKPEWWKPTRTEVGSEFS